MEHAKSFIFLRNNKRFEKAFNDTWSPVREMYQICQLLGIRFLVLLIPDELQVNDQLQQRVINASRLPPESFDFGLPNERLIAKFRESHIDYIDLREDFASISKSMRLYKPNDTHWNMAGNRTASELIAKHMAATWQ